MINKNKDNGEDNGLDIIGGKSSDVYYCVIDIKSSREQNSLF